MQEHKERCPNYNRSMTAERGQLLILSRSGVGLLREQADQILNAFVSVPKFRYWHGASISRSIVESTRPCGPNQPDGGATFSFKHPSREAQE